MGIRGSLEDVQMVGWNFMRILDFYYYQIFAVFYLALGVVFEQLCEHTTVIKFIIEFIIVIIIQRLRVDHPCMQNWDGRQTREKSSRRKLFKECEST